eukprot:scaffold16312_cov59-Cylindrotheca_fusiformis.AAC.1
MMGNDDDQWEVTSVFPGAEVSLSSDGRRTIGVVERFDPGFAVYDELETESCGLDSFAFLPFPLPDMPIPSQGFGFTAAGGAVYLHITNTKHSFCCSK